MSISIAQHDTLLRVAFGSVTNAYASLGALKDSFALIRSEEHTSELQSQR